MLVADSGIPLENLTLLSSLKTDCYFIYLSLLLSLDYFLFRGGLLIPRPDFSKEIYYFCYGNFVVNRLSKLYSCGLPVNPLLNEIPSSLLSSMLLCL